MEEDVREKDYVSSTFYGSEICYTSGGVVVNNLMMLSEKQTYS